MRGSAGLGSYVSSAFLTLYFLGILNVFLRNSLGVIGPEIAVSLAIEPVVLGGVASAFFSLMRSCRFQPAFCSIDTAPGPRSAA